MSALAITNVAVVDMAAGKTVPAQTVVIRDRRIESVGPTQDVVPPDDALRLDGTGKTLIPGLYDMHVHISPANPAGAEDAHAALDRAATYIQVFLTAGVTTVRNMAGTPLHLKLREAVEAGRVVGPRIFTCGPILETRFTFPEMAEFGELVTTAEEARAAVRQQAAAGFDFIKVYNDIEADIYDAIIATAREVGIRVVGHVAFQKGLHGALQARQDSIEHLRSYDFAVDTRTGDVPWERYKGWLYATPLRIDELAEQTAEAGVCNAPTSVVEHSIRADDEMAEEAEPLPAFLPEWMASEIELSDLGALFSSEQRQVLKDGRAARSAMVAALDRVGAGVLAGSDCPGCRLVPGRSLVREIELMVEAGLSPWRALRTATVNAAAFLGEPGEGRIQTGARADLVLLKADPLDDITALRRQTGVVTNGRWLPQAALEQMILGAA
ncbi:amidohydrolase family protein [Novosphingobium sp. Gsoil 351]|uniref:amidohydrolase family protein n=1 Tax=Novosphingobium sp. Gsoil 351 TaxID=2675225 RepID=UPI0012B4C0EC|nr:amidohydrolase family protein [Novosphingobium sp. Gsoil 351]QGN55454.1 amidohydrolase family protein [Novosphingobium sp. Gsoil 351]